MSEHDCDEDRCNVCGGCRVCECPISRLTDKEGRPVA